jgi:hypothetical protein
MGGGVSFDPGPEALLTSTSDRPVVGSESAPGTEVDEYGDVSSSVANEVMMMVVVQETTVIG